MADNKNEILFGADFVRGDESDGTYNFYQFQKSSGIWIIMRTTKTNTEAKYAVGDRNSFDSAWTNRLTSTEFNFPVSYPSI